MRELPGVPSHVARQPFLDPIGIAEEAHRAIRTYISTGDGRKHSTSESAISTSRPPPALSRGATPRTASAKFAGSLEDFLRSLQT